MMCQLKGVEVMAVVPLRLAGGAFTVWSQLQPEERQNAQKTKSALYAAFGKDKYAAWSEFRNRRLRLNESPDVFLAELRKLAESVGNVSEDVLECAFVTGLPNDISEDVQSRATAEKLNLEGMVAMARMIIKRKREVNEVCCQASTDRKMVGDGNVNGGQRRLREREAKCYICGQTGHLCRLCPRKLSSVICFRCSKSGHYARECPENSPGEGASALAPSQSRQ